MQNTDNNNTQHTRRVITNLLREIKQTIYKHTHIMHSLINTHTNASHERGRKRRESVVGRRAITLQHITHISHLPSKPLDLEGAPTSHVNAQFTTENNKEGTNKTSQYLVTKYCL